MAGKMVVRAALNAWGSLREPRILSSSSTSFWRAPMAVSSVPIRTPKPMSRPTSAIMSPKPCTKVPIVSPNPSPAATPRLERTYHQGDHGIDLGYHQQQYYCDNRDGCV